MIRHLRYEGARLDDVLARIRKDHGPDATILSAEQVRSGGVAGFFTKELFQVIVDPSGSAARPAATAPPAAVATPAAPGPPPAATGEASANRFAELLAELIDDVELSDGYDDGPGPTRAATSGAPGVPAPAASTPKASGLLPPTQVAHRLLSAPAPTAGEDSFEEVIDLIDGSDQLTGPDAPVDIDALLQRISERIIAPPAVIGSGILAIIGTRGDAIRSAIAVAESCGGHANDVLVAAPTERPVTPEAMATFVRESALQRAARGMTGPTLVAVVVVPGLGGHRWATELLTELAPLQTRLAVAGWRPFDRLEQTIAGLGGVDVVDLVDSGRAPEPERFLDLAVPIGMIDGRAATPTIWAATLASLGRAGHVEARPAVDPAAEGADADSELWEMVTDHPGSHS